jgi:hypothetical protein
MRPTLLAIAAVLALPIPGTALEAQQSASSLLPPASQLAATARLQLARSVPLLDAKADDRTPLDLARPSRRTGETLMIVGGAVLLVGLLADETIVSIAGVAIGGYGLYVYLNAPRRR